MISKKVCMLGGFAVGKTSLVSRFVRSIFSEKYLTTVGVKIDKKTVAVPGNDVDLVLWDIYGEDDFQKMRASYLRGANGYLLVVDGTRKATLKTARDLHRLAVDTVGPVPFLVLVNKADLIDTWEVDVESVNALGRDGWTVVKTSAKTGLGVEEAFARLAVAMLNR
jgi:small GTP-binding protein